jgi:CPA2 family monovalent cation:H+ antiporter-2
VEEREEIIERLLEQGIETITGNAASADTLRAAAVDRATLIYITVPDGFEAGRIAEIARQQNPAIRILARSHSDAEAEHLAGRGADVIISGEEEIAQAMIDATGPKLAGA